MRRRTLTRAAALLLTALIVTGCWSRKEIQELSIITAIGIDRAEESEGVEVTIQIARPLNVPRPGAGGGGGAESAGTRPFFFVIGRGATLQGALAETIRSEPRRPYLAQLQVVVIGERAARAGVGPHINYLWPHPEIRPFVDMIVVQGQARDFLRVWTAQRDITGRALVNMMERASRVGFARSVQLVDLLYGIKTAGVEPFLPVLAVDPSETPDQETAPSVPRTSAEGLAVLNPDRLAAFLDRQASRGVLWARGEVGLTSLTVVGGGVPDEYTSLNVTGAKKSITLHPRSRPGQPVVRLSVTAELGLRQRERLPTPITVQAQERIRALVERTIRAEILAAIEQTHRPTAPT